MTLEEAKKELQGVITINEQLADDDLFNTLIEALDDLMWYRKQNLIQLDDAINATKGIFHCGSYVSDIIKDLPLVEECRGIPTEDFEGLIETQPTVNRWIPVEEALPERYEWVLVAWEEHSTGFRGVPTVAELRRNECWGFQEEMPKEYLDDLDVIAWKPIEPYVPKE